MKKGFSIIELSIVIVIIGVLISIFFFARGVVDTARVNGIISEITYFKNAQESFREKYGFRPGDVPVNVLNAQGFTGNSADTCAISTLGNNSWDNITERDLTWIQLSAQKFIRQQIDFDPCPSPAAPRNIGTHRPASEAITGTGWTYMNLDQVVVGANTYSFLYALRVGQPKNLADTDFSQGKIKVGIHIDIDAKIDSPFTPTSGKYYVGTECIDPIAGIYYGGKTSPLECIGGYAEVPSEEIESTYTP